MSPAWSAMLSLGSPDSRSLSKLRVIWIGGGSATLALLSLASADAGRAMGLGVAAFCAVSSTGGVLFAGFATRRRRKRCRRRCGSDEIFGQDRRHRIVQRIGRDPRHDDRVRRVIRYPSGLGEKLQQRYCVVRLIHHRVIDSANHGDRLAALFFDGNADLRMRNETVGLQNFRNLLLDLNFGKPRDMQAHWEERQGDGARLADAHVARQLIDVKHLDGKHVAAADDVLALLAQRGERHRFYPLVSFLRRLEAGLSAAGWSSGKRAAGDDDQHPQRGGTANTHIPRTQSCWLHGSMTPGGHYTSSRGASIRSFETVHGQSSAAFPP